MMSPVPQNNFRRTNSLSSPTSPHWSPQSPQAVSPLPITNQTGLGKALLISTRNRHKTLVTANGNYIQQPQQQAAPCRPVANNPAVVRAENIENNTRNMAFTQQWPKPNRQSISRYLFCIEYQSDKGYLVRMGSIWAIWAYRIAPRTMFRFRVTNRLVYPHLRQAIFRPWLPMKSRVSYRVRSEILASMLIPLRTISTRPITPRSKPPQGSSQPIIAIIGMNGVIKLCPWFSIFARFITHFYSQFDPLFNSVNYGDSEALDTIFGTAI